MNAKVDKKKEKLKLQIERLETELRTSLHKKAAGPAISVGDYTSKITKLKMELEKL